ncbi:7-deoxyloganetin glucosyltransferase [Neltuma alba]|uniref:7-deoxyloganetin glucosyltransferase n=1 Tax=Neltuma alba TaxID=207710 RepID=UPI0010A472FF|nr:7-deoxyloganetin glucosyltransferase-like [Prosopis alba]XP_028789948.1 7-deoxyloganetin glucosyltransferase-like [Prosopis alba]
MDSMERGGSKPHVVVTPFPIQSHLNTFLNLAKLLHSRGFHITYVNTEYNHRRLLKTRGPQALDGLPDFRFETIPDGLPYTDSDATQHLPSLAESTSKNCLIPFTSLLNKLQESASNGLVPPVTSLVSDAVMAFTVKAAQEFGLPIAIYCPISAISYLGGWHGRTLLDKGIIPLKDESYLTNGCLDTKLDWLEGMKNMRLRDLPSHFSSLDPDDYLMLKFCLNELQTVKSADAIIFNTFSELESEALNTLSSIFPPLYTIGPVPLVLNQVPHNHVLDSIGANLWKEDAHCIEWLESQKPKSVVYVNFGSVTVMSAEQLHEFAWGLANSKKPFLWIIRPDLVDGGSMILSPEFLSETKERGFIASWCEQQKVLNHPSIGGFLTHCGWNSIIESICSGVSMACWPFSGDQQTNCRYACTEWGIGIEIDNNVKREVVERLVNELIEGDKGKEMRQKVLEWQKISKEATKSGGSSCISLDKLINQVLIKRN